MFFLSFFARRNSTKRALYSCCVPPNASLISPQSSITFVFRQKSFKLLLYIRTRWRWPARAGHSGSCALLLLAQNYFYYLLRIEGRDDYVVTGQYSLCSLFSPINRKVPLAHTQFVHVNRRQTIDVIERKRETNYLAVSVCCPFFCVFVSIMYNGRWSCSFFYMFLLYFVVMAPLVNRSHQAISR